MPKKKPAVSRDIIRGLLICAINTATMATNVDVREETTIFAELQFVRPDAGEPF